MANPKFTKGELATLKKASAKIAEAIELARGILDEARERKDEAQSTWDDRSEKWQQGDKGQEASEAINAFDYHLDALEEFADDAENASHGLDGLLDEVAV